MFKKKKTELLKTMEEIGFPKSPSEIKINHTKEIDNLYKELENITKTLPLTLEQKVDLIACTVELLLKIETNAYIAGMGDGFEKGADWTQKYIENEAKENAKKYDVRLYEKEI